MRRHTASKTLPREMVYVPVGLPYVHSACLRCTRHPWRLSRKNTTPSTKESTSMSVVLCKVWHHVPGECGGIWSVMYEKGLRVRQRTPCAMVWSQNSTRVSHIGTREYLSAADENAALWIDMGSMLQSVGKARVMARTLEMRHGQLRQVCHMT